METIQIGKRNDSMMYAAVDEEALHMGVMPLIRINKRDIEEMGDWRIVKVEYDSGIYPMSEDAMERAILTRAWDKVNPPNVIEMGRRGGSVSSEAKAEAARRNGRKGGRPKKSE